MPDNAEELSAAELQALTQAINHLIGDLQTQLQASIEAEKPVELDQGTTGRLTRMQALAEREMVRAGRRGLGLRLEQAKSARHAIAQGEYGLCRRCEEPIGYARLRARPESPFCLGCQGDRERGSN